MDNRKEYIKMCEKVVPYLIDYFNSNISKLRPMFVYDTATERISVLLWAPSSIRKKLGIENDEIILSVEYDRDMGAWIPEGTPQKIIPLWTQDQLQKIILDSYQDAIKFMYAPIEGKVPEAGELLWEFARWEDEENFNGEGLAWPGVTMEQLWLGFVMNRLYNKNWNDEKEEWTNT